MATKLSISLIMLAMLLHCHIAYYASLALRVPAGVQTTSEGPSKAVSASPPVKLPHYLFDIPGTASSPGNVGELDHWPHKHKKAAVIMSIVSLVAIITALLGVAVYFYFSWNQVPQPPSE